MSRLLKIFSQLSPMVLGFFAGLGLSTAALTEAIRLRGWAVPCRTSVCGQIAADLLNGYPPFTPGFLAAGYFLVFLLMLQGPERWQRLAANLAVPAVIVSWSLVSYTQFRYGGVCNPCLLIAGCTAALGSVCVLGGANLNSRLNRPFAIGAALVGAIASVAYFHRETKIGVDQLALSRMSFNEVSPPENRLIGVQAGDVLIVDFSCGICRQELGEALSAGKPFAVRSLQRGDYDAACAKYLSAHQSPAGKARVLRLLLADKSLTPQAIARLPAPPGKPIETALRRDRVFAEALGIVTVPTELKLTPSGYRLGEVFGPH